MASYAGLCRRRALAELGEERREVARADLGIRKVLGPWDGRPGSSLLRWGHSRLRGRRGELWIGGEGSETGDGGALEELARGQRETSLAGAGDDAQAQHRIA